MTDRDELTELASNLGLLVDARDWPALEALFCEAADVDYRSLSGGEPQETRPPDLVEGWKANLSPLRATQHLIANHVVALDGDEAHVATNVTATHVSADEADEHWVVDTRPSSVARACQSREGRPHPSDSGSRECPLVHRLWPFGRAVRGVYPGSLSSRDSRRP